ncbi:MAG: hypothetical protein RXO35_02630 [Candidatus Micrarchaeota archaeon]
MWPFNKPKHASANAPSNNENRPIKMIEIGHNAWQIVHADEKN